MEKPEKVIPEKVIGYKFGPIKSTMNLVNCMTYSIGIGFSNDPMKIEDLDYTFENADEFKVFPLNSSVIRDYDPFLCIFDCPGLPMFNPSMLLHGEQKTHIIKQLEMDVTYLGYMEYVDIIDKGKGALLVQEVRVFEEKEDGTPGDLVSINVISFFIRGIGGFGFAGKLNQTKMSKVPKTAPNFEVVEKTNPNQALIYRLSGDTNAIHIDPAAAEMGKLPRPILHGLCFYGISAKVVIQKLAENDCARLKTIRARFTNIVFPGETLVYSLWVKGNTVIFSAKTQERGKVVIVGEVLLTEAPKI